MTRLGNLTSKDEVLTSVVTLDDAQDGFPADAKSVSDALAAKAIGDLDGNSLDTYQFAGMTYSEAFSTQNSHLTDVIQSFVQRIYLNR